jgi:hypothetical protein
MLEISDIPIETANSEASGDFTGGAGAEPDVPADEPLSHLDAAQRAHMRVELTPPRPHGPNYRCW